MITYLKIKNFIIVKEITLKFSEGLQALTGETGAGKSIIIGALQLLMGGSAKKGLLFEKSQSAYLEAGFSIDKKDKELNQLLQYHNFSADDEELFFAKEITPNIKGKSFINGRRVTNSIVKDFAEILIDFHSQRDQLLILNQDYQLEILDKFAGFDSLFSQYQNQFNDNKSLKTELSKIVSEQQKNKQLRELYSYQLEEIEKAKLRDGEEESLQQEFHLLDNAESIISLSENINFSLYESDKSVYNQISGFDRELSSFANDNPHLKNLSELMQEVKISLENINGEIRALDGVIELDEERLQKVNNRLDELSGLRKKYNKTIAEIISYKHEIEDFLTQTNSLEKKIDQLQNQIEKSDESLLKLAEKLSDQRKQAATKLTNEIVTNLRRLSIPDIDFVIRFKDLRLNQNDVGKLTNNGFDEIEFYMSANKGVEVQPLQDAASGGELSRILLAIKTILSESLSGRTIIFDEIDSGVGGKTADILGEFIKKISNNHQVLLITHLPQVAAFADSHYKIMKGADNKKTIVNVILLDEKSKVIEIARMLSGNVSSLSKEHAAELINKKGEGKSK